MVECVVEFEYVAQEEDELTIRPGEIISNVQKQDGGWWEGEVNGRKGMFPDNFVKEIKQEAKKAAPESNHRTSVKKVSAGGGHVAELANRLGKEGAIRIGPPAPGAPGPLKREVSQVKRQQRVKVTFSYNPENNDELRLEVGDVVTVTKQEEEGWWEGILKGKTGMFPSNFVESFDEDGGGPGEASGDEVNTPEIEIHGKKIKGVGLGNIFSAGPIKLRSTGSKDHPSAVKREPPPPKKEPIANEHEKRDSLKRNAAPSEPPPSLPPKDQPTVKPLERARVLYSYSAENDDELNIDEGEVVNILDKELEDSGWWKGEINGKMGVFPDNFVELLPPEEPQHKPRKPPPPSAQPGRGKIPPPSEPAKPAEPVKVKEEPKAEPHRAVPTVPGNRPALPPPVGKKPVKHADPKLMAQTDDHKDHNHLDSVESTEKLNHPTANRARAPSRRLPSSVHGKEQGSPPPQPKQREDEEKRISRPAPPKMRPPPPTPTKEDKSILDAASTHAPAVSSHTAGPAGDAVSSSAVDELRRELEHLKMNTVPKRKFEELLSEHTALKDSVTQLKSTFNKKLLDLMTEIDEEKKVRLNMQVEIDRVKKLAMS